MFIFPVNYKHKLRKKNNEENRLNTSSQVSAMCIVVSNSWSQSSDNEWLSTKELKILANVFSCIMIKTWEASYDLQLLHLKSKESHVKKKKKRGWGVGEGGVTII